MRTQVKAFLPIDITDDLLISSSIPEPDPDEPLWDTTTPFAEGAWCSVISANSHLVFESLIAGNVNNDPLKTNTDVVPASTAKWIKRSYTNRFRMFNWYQGNPSRGQSPLTVVIRPKRRINALVLDGIKASVLELTIKNGMDGPEIFTMDGWLLSRHASTFYEYCYAPFVYDSVVSSFEIPPIPDPVISVTLTDPSGICELRRFGVGLATEIGMIDWNSVSEDNSYSDIEFDSSGWPTLKPNEAPSSLEMQLELDAPRVNAVAQFKKTIKNKPVFWSAMEQVDAYSQMHVMVGIPERFRIIPQNHKIANVDLRLIGI